MIIIASVPFVNYRLILLYISTINITRYAVLKQYVSWVQNVVRQLGATGLSCEVMDESRPIGHIESPRQEWNPGLGIAIVFVIHEPEFIPE